MTEPRKQPRYHICKTCHTQIPINEWDEHLAMEAAQTEMFPDMPRAPKPSRRSRKELA